MANLKNKLSEDVSKTKVLRGGRLTKWKGKVASLSPSLGQLVATVSPIALGRALSIGANRTLLGAAWGGAGLLVTVGSAGAACLEDKTTPGVFFCSVPETTSQNLSATGTLLDVTINPNASFTTTAGDAFYLSGDAGITFLNNNATATITGDLSGIEANNTGSGALSITTDSTTTGYSDYGINATNSGSSLSINAVGTEGNSVGINAYNSGSGALTIITTGTTAANTSIFSTGIEANNKGTDLTITASGSTRGGAGIVATNDGSGDLSITTALVTEGTKEGGINATNYGQDLIVYSENVYGFGRAVFVSQEGLGLTDITTTGRVISTTSEGVYAYIGSGASNASIDTNYVSGGAQGIEANSWGDAGLHITTGGSTTGIADEGIRAYVASSGTYLIVATNGVTSGGTEGIFANNDGTGALTITTTSTTNGNAGSGIYANNSINGTGLSITTTNDTTGAASGVEAKNYGSGNLYINAGGTTTGNGVGNYGIYASNSPNGIDLLIVADTVTGDYQGIRAGNGGTGQLSITTTGTINGRYDTGIYARNASTGTDFTIVSAITTGAFYGIYARAKGDGDMSITTTGATTAYGTNAASGIDAENSIRGANLNITASTTTGALDGIWAHQRGTDALTINITGAIEGTERYGIYAWNEKGTSLTITNTPDNASNITGGAFGIYASNDGTGALSITVSGVTTATQDILGDDNAGIYAWNSTYSTGGLIISANETYGADLGIIATNEGYGDLSITTTGRTTAADNTSYGIGAYARGYSTGLTIDAQYVKAGAVGIYAYNGGSGTLSITARDRVIGTYRSGIDAYNGLDGDDLRITALNTVGGYTGISATNLGSGELYVRTSGYTYGGTGNGINVINLRPASVIPLGGTQQDAYYPTLQTDLTVIADGSTSGSTGIFAYHHGSGALTITTTGTTTGNNSHGVSARAATGTDLTLNVADTSGDHTGIRATHNGSGILSVTSTATATGIRYDGIYVQGSGAGVAVMAYNSTGGRTGIYAGNYGTGAITITTSGTTTGAARYGIFAYNYYGTDISITAEQTIGGMDGIRAVQYNGVGTTRITTAGVTTGGTGSGIYTDSPTGQAVQITLNGGSDVSSTSGNAIVDTDADASVTVNTGASVTGSIALGGGVDTLTFAGGDFSGVTSFDGGDGASDILSFAGSGGALDSTIISNWERVEITAGSTISFSNNLLAVNTLSIGTGGIFDATSGTFTLTGNLNNTGTLRLSDGDVSDVVNVSGNFVGGGTISMDVNTAAQTSDTLDIAGDASGTTQIAFTNMTPTSGSDNIIADVVTVQGTSSATNFSGSVVGGIYTYNLEYNAGSFDLVPTANSTSAAYKIAPTILGGFNQMSSLNQRMSQRQVGRVDVPTRLSFSALDPVEQEMPNLWLNIGGTRAQRVTSAGTDLEYNNRNIAFGADFELELGTSGRWVIGTHAQYGTQNGSVTDETGVSIASTTGIGAGISATWYGNSGTYVDTQAQMTQLKTEISSDAGGLLIEDAESNAYALSVEVGHQIELNGQSSLTPQAQLTFGKVNGASFTDTAGTIVDLGTSVTKTGRIGLAYEYQVAQSTFYSSGSIIRDFGSSTTVEAAGESFSEDTNMTWGEVGVGVSYAMNEATQLYGQIGYREALNNSKSNALSANLGIQIQW